MLARVLSLPKMKQAREIKLPENSLKLQRTRRKTKRKPKESERENGGMRMKMGF